MAKKNLTLMSPPVENETLPEELVKIAEEERENASFEVNENEERENIDFISDEDEERENIDFISDEDEETEDVFEGIKIKEVKYGFSVLTNIGNYENIRTQIEVTAEIEENEQMIDCINALSKQIKDWGRQEYKDIKQKAMATLPKRENK